MISKRLDMVLPTPARIIHLHERETFLFSRGDLVDREGRSMMLPATRALNAVELRDVAEGVNLRVLGLIGHLPLTHAITLNLRPKFPASNLWYMLEVAGEKYRRVLPVLRSYETAADNAPHHLLARSFCFYLQQILTVGLARGYVPREQEGYFAPKIDFGRTISRFLARGNEISTHSRSFVFSQHVLANRYLKAACLRFLRVLPMTPQWAEEKELILSALGALERTPAREPASPATELAETAPLRVREAYSGALTTHAILLGQTRIGFSFEAHGTPLPSFLFCLDDVFEDFVRNVLCKALRGAEISVVNGNINRNQAFLFRDNAQYPIKPDLIFREDRDVFAVGEVKYKERIKEADRYQLISHALALGVSTAIWISPALGPVEAGLKYVGLVGDRYRFYHYRLDISSALAPSCDRMADEIMRLLDRGGRRTRPDEAA